MYRVNYGNGQVGCTIPDLETAERVADLERGANRGAYAPFIYLQRYIVGSADEPGEWIRVSEPKE